jgi:acetamidase/formamidase
VSARVLHRGEGIPSGIPYLPVDAGTTLWGRLPCAADSAAVTIDSGGSVVIDTVSHEGLLDDQGSDPVAFFGRHGVAAGDVLREAVEIAVSGARDPSLDGPHVVTGPVHVRGALRGDVLAIRVEALDQRVPYGVISNRHGRGALAGEFPLGADNVSVFASVDGAGRGVIPLREGSDAVARFPLAPFLGIMGVATSGLERSHSVPPGVHGGNIDVNLLTQGSTLYLPVQVEGALAYVGDPHFAQGDGEVSLTAMEASLRARLRFDVIPRSQALAVFGDLGAPLAETAEFLVPTGMHEDLDEAVRQCVRASIRLLVARYGMEPHLAYAYLSAATDMNVSQVVDIVKGVHARIRKSDFAGVR